MANRTATTGNALLGLIALRDEWSTWDLAKQLERNMRFFWPRAASRVYDELKTLAESGLTKRKESTVGRRRRTSYSISAKGRRRLAQWLDTPPKRTTLECEPLLRVFLGKLGTTDNLLTALDQVRADANAILDVGRVVGDEYLARRAPFQDHVEVRAFVFDFLSHHALMLLAWADRAEKAVRDWERQDDAARERAALRRIRSTLAEYPATAQR